VLTYNRTLAADIRRLLALMGIRDGVAERSIAVSTVNDLVREWSVALGLVDSDVGDTSQEYGAQKSRLLSQLRDWGMPRHEIFELVKGASHGLIWDYVMVDEAQDWPRDERDLVYQLYGHERIVLADGIDQ